MKHILLLFSWLLSGAFAVNAQKADEEQKEVIKELFNGREVFVSAKIMDKSGINRVFYKTVKNMRMDILADAFYYSWDEVRGEQSMANQLVYSYSVTIPFKGLETVAPYFSEVKHPIGTEKDYSKIASIAFMLQKEKYMELTTTVFDVEGNQRKKKSSQTTNVNFVLIPYAGMDPSCSTCTYESLTAKPHKALIKFLNGG